MDHTLTIIIVALIRTRNVVTNDGIVLGPGIHGRQNATMDDSGMMCVSYKKEKK